MMKTLLCICGLFSCAASAADVSCSFEWPTGIDHYISITGKDVQWSSPRQYVEATATIRKNPIGTIWSFMVAPEFFISVTRESATIHKSGREETVACKEDK